MDSRSLIASLNKDDLTCHAPALMAWEIGMVDNIDEVAEFMYQGGPFPPRAGLLPPGETPPMDHRPPKKYWDYVKDEMAVFLCQDASRYGELWKRLEAFEKKNSTALVGIIAAYLGERAGVEATILAGFIAVVLYGAAKIGKEALCRSLHPPDGE